MSSDDNQRNQPQQRENFDPTEGDRPWPLYIWIFIMLMVAWATSYFALYSGDGQLAGGDQRQIEIAAQGPQPEEVSETSQSTAMGIEQRIEAGKKTYQSVCQACHQSHGKGLTGAFPPLVASSWVLGDTSVPIRIVLHGLAGPIEVKGEQYNGVMPAYKDQFNDEEIANVITYIRNTWGNQAPAATSAQVRSLRDQHATRSSPWSAVELKDDL